MNDHPIVAAGLHALLAPYVERVCVVELASQMPVASDIDLLLYDTFGRERVDKFVRPTPRWCSTRGASSRSWLPRGPPWG
jgi:hypothetical protein